jgi:hypothetical protein
MPQSSSDDDEMQTDSLSPSEPDIELDDEDEDDDASSSPLPSNITNNSSLPQTPPASRRIPLPSSNISYPLSADNTQQTLLSARELSPPDSQPRVREPRTIHPSVLNPTAAAATASAMLNSNGKRPLIDQHASNSLTGLPADRGTTGVAGGKEDENGPGSNWLSKKGQEEIHRAMEGVVDREYMLGNRYGDMINVRKDERLWTLYQRMVAITRSQT